LGGFLLVSLLVTKLIKQRFPNAQTWLIVSMVRFTKTQKIFDIFVKHPNLVNRLTDVGLVIGFGAVAVDYLWMQKRKTGERILVFAISMIALGSLTSFIFPTENPIIPIPTIVMQFFFGLFGLAGIILVGLFYSGMDIFTKLSVGKNACAGVAPVIPGVDLPNSPISVPLHAWLSFVIILIVHEASHGFVIRKLGMKLKSYGLLLLGFLPIGAFVEPDEEELKKLEKKNPRDALRMYVAGPSSNLYFFLIGGLLISIVGGFVVNPLIQPTLNEIHLASVSGVKINEVAEKITICGTEFNAPAFGVLLSGDQIISVDGKNVKTIQEYSLETRGKESFTLNVLRNGEEKSFTFEPNELGRLGITVQDIPNTNYTPPAWYDPFMQVAGLVTSFLGWLILLNFLVATANFIPVDPFDGGKMAKLLLLPYFGFLKQGEEETKKIIGKVFVGIVLVLVLINAAPLFMASAA
ncbi:MAG: site-2 protease family protein, partial [Candidatus Diapherotrites archaeon]|nr:site-2 protease family protein [Candidatus Diapherotrites archaeon]